MFIGKCYMLQDGNKALLALQALNEVIHGMQACQGMQRTAMMPRWQV
jgi:hypothetical protein